MRLVLLTKKELESTLGNAGQQNLITGQVSLAYYRVLAARSRIKSFLKEALPEAEAVSRISRKGDELGQTDLKTLLDSQRQNLQVISQYLDAVLAYQLALNDPEEVVAPKS